MGVIRPWSAVSWGLHLLLFVANLSRPGSSSCRMQGTCCSVAQIPDTACLPFGNLEFDQDHQQHCFFCRRIGQLLAPEKGVFLSNLAYGRFETGVKRDENCMSSDPNATTYIEYLEASQFRPILSLLPSEQVPATCCRTSSRHCTTQAKPRDSKVRLAPCRK